MYQAKNEPCQKALSHGFTVHEAVKEKVGVRVIQCEAQRGTEIIALWLMCAGIKKHISFAMRPVNVVSVPGRNKDTGLAGSIKLAKHEQ